MVQSFKQALRKSDHHPKQALQEFLLHYRRTPLPAGYSPSELLNGRQIRTRIDLLLPSPAHTFQQKQSASKSPEVTPTPTAGTTVYPVGTLCYALYQGPRRDKEARWVPATVVRVLGERCVNVKVSPHGPVWRRHVEQLQPRYSNNCLLYTSDAADE